ncbi:MAG: hypothetical protein WCA12_10215, partial [Burkholderiales bacterium]
WTASPSTISPGAWADAASGQRVFVAVSAGIALNRLFRNKVRQAGKQRNGTIGTVNLTFLGQHTRFENFAAPERAWQPRSS